MRRIRRAEWMCRGLALGIMLVAGSAGAVTIDWVEVGDPGNAADPDTSTDNCGPSRNQGCGAVTSPYRIAKYEVTNSQYAELLNAKAASDPLALYNTNMGSNATFGGITRSGSSGSYTYAAKTGFETKPVTYVSFYDAIRFSNWLNNGQGAASTETGAYTLLGGTATPSNGLTVLRNPGASVWLPSESEWYKAAYYDPISNGYFDYPTGTNTPTGCVAPGSDTGNSANCDGAAGSVLTNVGAYGLSDSPNGTFDLGGNVWEWNEQIISGSFRGLRGGAWLNVNINLSAASWSYDDPPDEFAYVGFRVASIPEPATGLLVMAGLAGLALRRRVGA